MGKNRQVLGLLFIHFFFAISYISAQTTTLVAVGTNGKLVYTADAKGNVIPDFSGVGYMNSEAVIPTVAVVKTVMPISGDNRANVQAAINEVAALPLDANGFRGTILFKKGTYNISDTIFIKSSGIVLRGEGTDAAGTVFIGTKTAQFSVFYFAAASNTSNISASKKAITDAYLPIGAKKVTVTAGHSFVVGDNVFVHRVPNQAWIDFLTMAQWGWTPSAYDVYYERKITAVNGNQLTIDAPVMDVIDPVYATGEVVKFTSARIEKCGIENMRINSTFASETDEKHGWEAVTFENLINGWARQLEVYYFGYSAVHIESHASFITVQDCKMLDAKSILDGGRRYSFNVDGQRCLVQNCWTRQGRHDYVNGSQTAGPNVFYNCTATDQNADMGPHHRWSTGILFDNITGTNDFISVQNRTNSGTGHGWSGAQTMFWNCDVPGIICQDPQGDHRNWAIGCVGNVTNVGNLVTEPLCIVESRNRHIAAIPSLFKAQLAERLTTTPVADVPNATNKLVVKTTLAYDVLDIIINENTAIILNIFNTTGQKVLTAKAQGEKQLNISTLPAGLYIIQTESGGVGRFVKN